MARALWILALAGLSAGLLFLAFRPAAPSGAVRAGYRGFEADYLDGSRGAMEEEVHRQIDAVCSVGLDAGTLGFLRGLTIWVRPDRPASPGDYHDGRVELDETALAEPYRPILLHEFMHAYQNQALEGGLENPDLLTFYARARVMSAYDPNSHMMSNLQEYFATTATTYLFGRTDQEPFTRDRLARLQPLYVDWLKRRFGPAAGTAQGNPDGPGGG